MIVTCGNPNHPDGAWHPAGPLPYSWQYIKRVRNWWRKRAYGCDCSVSRTVPGGEWEAAE